ncbi:MAG: ABC transporter permease, partial [Clostridia bacterium]|nr:ABC transporter permease [Clostridia bacterium]
MKKKSFLEGFAAVPHAVWALLFIAAPLVFVVYFAFTDAYGNFTFDNITKLSSYTHIFVLSVCFALISTVICLLIAYPLAFALSRMSQKAQRILIVLLM